MPDDVSAAEGAGLSEVNRVARLLMAEWERVDGPVNVSRVANFPDMARAVIADREHNSDSWFRDKKSRQE